MAFIQKQGYWRSENGWRMCDTAELDFSPVPVVGWKVGVRKGAPNYILKAAMTRLHLEVEPMDIRQCGVYTAENSMPNSNHNSATAFDYNWNKHPYQKWNTWGANRHKVDKIIADFRGILEFGGNWTSPRDEMHFELHFAEGHSGTEALANDLKNGLWGIFKPGAPPTNEPGQQRDDYLEIGDTGPEVLTLQKAMNKVFPNYRATPLDEDSIFGPMTAAAVSEFQERVGIAVDGIVGPVTRAKLAEHGIKLNGTTAPEGPMAGKQFPNDWSDREIGIDALQQLRGYGLKGHPQLGKNDKGEDLTIVDALAETKKNTEEILRILKGN